VDVRHAHLDGDVGELASVDAFGEREPQEEAAIGVREPDG
jgi:hypothetical protein